MINKFYKIINNSFLKVSRFVTYLGYLSIIFFISSALFISLPIFFNFEKKEEIIKNHLLKDFKIEVKKFENITYKIFPTPNIELTNLIVNIESNDLITEKFKVFPKLTSIYNLEKLDITKIKFKEIEMITDIKNFTNFNKTIINLKKKINFDNLNVRLKNDNKFLINLDQLKYKNYGYNKDYVEGKIFNKNFIIKSKNHYRNIKFEIKNSGFEFELDFPKEKEISGIYGNIKVKLLNYNLKSTFLYSKNELKIIKLFFRDKDLSFDSEGTVLTAPFFKSKIKTKINQINLDITQNLKVDKILKKKNLIKKINSDNIFLFDQKKFSSGLVKNLFLKTNLAHGRLTYSKKLKVASSDFNCNGDINLLEQFPILTFSCNLKSKDINKLFRKLDLKFDKKTEKLKIYVTGNLNILSKKINFSTVRLDPNYIASKADLEFFKKTFEEILFDENFTNIFKITKIKKFINEIN